MSILKSILKKIKEGNPSSYLRYKRLRQWLDSKLLSDEKYVIDKFQNNFHCHPDLKIPRRYNEYISKILLTPPSELVQKCVDKYEARAYVEAKAGRDILNDLLGVYHSTDELEKGWHRLPDKFVLKATHGCGWNLICKDKNKADLKDVLIQAGHWLKSSFYYAQRELIYKNLEPKIIAEEYLEDETGGLTDYKVHCFKGEPKFINVIVDRFSNMTLNTYDMNWNFIDVNFDEKYPNRKDLIIKKPREWKDLIKYSRLLSEDFDYVRTDFYIARGKVYWGELTFTPGNGAYQFSEEEDLFFGSFFNS